MLQKVNYIASKPPGSDSFTHRVGCKSDKNKKMYLLFCFSLDILWIWTWFPEFW